jgi:hypothetical protein
MEQLIYECKKQLFEDIIITKHVCGYMLSGRNNKIKMSIFENDLYQVSTIIDNYKICVEYKNRIDSSFNDDFIILTFSNFSQINDKPTSIFIVGYYIEIYGFDFFKCYNKINELYNIGRNIKVKYGNECDVYYYYGIEVTIDNVQTENLDLLDFVPHEPICNKTTYTKININNCTNVKNILNYIELKNYNDKKISLFINNCPRLETDIIDTFDTTKYTFDEDCVDECVFDEVCI